jgi:hypothetical protein
MSKQFFFVIECFIIKSNIQILSELKTLYYCICSFVANEADEQMHR